MHAIVSIHDVMPATMRHETNIIDCIQPSHQRRLCLLVVPRLERSTLQIDPLHKRQGDGKISLPELRNTPFRYFENSGGLLDARTGHYRRLPLLGFKADTLVRQTFLTDWNTLNQHIGSASRPVRISIHPMIRVENRPKNTLPFCKK